MIRVAVIGHTNTGKTSLMRTLLRSETFGDVADRPGVTRRLQSAVMEADGKPVIELIDTPGLEDSIALLEWIESHEAANPRALRVDAIQALIASPAGQAGGRFAQESIVLEALLSSDAAVYVIDVRDPIRAKHHDELRVLSGGAVPLIPILNFLSDPTSNEAEWRSMLRRVGLHAVAAFDTVIFDAAHERQLFDMLRSLRSDAAPDIQALVDARSVERDRVYRASMTILAEMLVDVAAMHVDVDVEVGSDHGDARDASGTSDSLAPSSRAMIGSFRAAVVERERLAAETMLSLHRFFTGRLDADAVPDVGGVRGLDLFSPEALKRAGLDAGSAAAAGAAIGLGLDAALAGLSLGTGALAGAAVGGAFGALRLHGRRLVARLRGRTELRADDATLVLLAIRGLALLAALERRGHASQDVVRTADASGAPRAGDQDMGFKQAVRELTPLFRVARAHPEWAEGGGGSSTDPAAEALVTRVAERLNTLAIARATGT